MTEAENGTKRIRGGRVMGRPYLGRRGTWITLTHGHGPRGGEAATVPSKEGVYTLLGAAGAHQAAIQPVCQTCLFFPAFLYLFSFPLSVCLLPSSSSDYSPPNLSYSCLLHFVSLRVPSLTSSNYD